MIHATEVYTGYSRIYDFAGRAIAGTVQSSLTGFCQLSCEEVSATLALSGERSGAFQDAEHGHGSAEEMQSTAGGRDVLAGEGARTEKVAQFIVTSAEPGG